MPLNLRSSRRNAYRRAQTGPVEGLPSHLTTAALVRLAFPRGPQDARGIGCRFLVSMPDFFLDNPKLRSDLCDS